MKTILITPGSHGIGAAIARELGKEHQIILSYRNHKDEAYKLAEELPHAVAYQADLEEPSSVDNLMKEAENHFETVDILIHTASIFPEANLDATDLDLWNKTINANLTTAFNLYKAVLPPMRASQWGRIISFVDAGIWSQKAYPKFIAYHVAKAGLMELVRSTARTELKNGITVNAIAPGTVENSDPKPDLKTIPLGRYILLDEVVAAVQYLISDDAAPMTGAMMPITGGVGL